MTRGWWRDYLMSDTCETRLQSSLGRHSGAKSPLSPPPTFTLSLVWNVKRLSKQKEEGSESPSFPFCRTANHKEDNFPKEEQLWKQEWSEAGIFGEQAFCIMKAWGGSQHLFAQDRHPPIKAQSLRPCKTEPVAV
ncbi:hypothetical protein F2P79_002828 [Pimephales promelas]|nr:hypothetical protein F2P79_002828 [Pimephales promelas]